MLTLDVFQHADSEGPGSITAWAEANDVTLRLHRPDLGARIQLLNPADLDGVIVLGGPQSVNDDDAWLAAERIIIRSLIKLGRPVVGICLGAQQIVRALGAAVTPLATGEYGRTLVADEAGNSIPVFQWHGEGMASLPGSTPLFHNAVQANQGFTYHKRTLGLQFHLEWAQADQAALTATRPGTAALSAAETEAAAALLNQLLTATIL